MTARIYEIAASRSREGSATLPASPRASSVRPLLPHRLANAMRDDEALRAIEARLNGPPRHRIVRDQRRIGLACMALSAFVVLYMIGQLLRAVL